MNDDEYLWDRSGDADPEVEHLEKLLGRYRHDAPLRVAAHRQRRRRWLAIAAAVVLFALTATAVTLALRLRWRTGAAWDITAVAGAPTIDGRPIDRRDVESGQRLAVGEELRTDERSRATVRIARVGEMDIAPRSRVILTATGRGRHRVQLESGTISARVWAPPFTFAVRTPAGQANDIGCAFTIRYEEGVGEIRVTSGWIDFDGAQRSAIIPAGAVSELRDELGPGTPYYDDAPPRFRAALRAFDFQHDTNALKIVIAEARPRDAMTLLHLLERSHDYAEWRGPLFDRLSVLAPPPRGFTRQHALERDLEQIDAWRHSLGLGGVKAWWRQWRDALPR